MIINVNLDESIIDSIPEGPSKNEILEIVKNGGLNIVELSDQESVFAENKKMRNYVGQIISGVCKEVRDKWAKNAIESGQWKVYSLRDSNEKSYATMLVIEASEDPVIAKIKGEKGQPPVEIYRPFILQWVLNNNLKVLYDVDACLSEKMLEELLRPYESIENYEKIRNVDLGIETIYKKSFIPKMVNEFTLFTKTKNMNFLKRCIVSRKEFVSKINDDEFNLIRLAYKQNLNINHNMVYFIANKDGSHRVYTDLCLNDSLPPKWQKHFIGIGCFSYLEALSINLNLTEENKKELTKESIKKHRRDFFEEADVV